MTSRPRGFTLIEALAVIALMALLTAAAAVSLRGAARTARIEDVADAFAGFDRGTREFARRFDRTPALRFDLNRGTVSRTGADREPTPLVLAGDVRVTRVIAGGAVRISGEVALPFSSLGQSPSYAVQLAGPAGERWALFAGLTGQPMVLRNEQDALDILAPAASKAGGPDAR